MQREGIHIWTQLILSELNIWFRMPGYLWAKVADYVYYFVCGAAPAAAAAAAGWSLNEKCVMN